MPMTTHRSEIFALADSYIDESAAFSPINSTFLGIPGRDHELDDFSVAGSAKSAAHTRETLVKLTKLNPIDDIDRIARDVMVERLEAGLKLHDSFESHVLWGVISSPPSGIRQVFEMMPHETEEHFKIIELRLLAVDKSLKSWISAIDEVAKKGKTTAQRQVRGVATQLNQFADGGYESFVKGIDSEGKHPELILAAKSAQEACKETANWLLEKYFPIATEKDAVGHDRYIQWARYFTGAELDLEEIYNWGVKDLAYINERMWKVAAQIKPDAKSLREVADYLETAPEYEIHGVEALLKKLRDFTDAAVKQMDGVHFDIDDSIKFCDARIAPDGSAAAPYYMQPSEDLSRPGTTWFPTLGKDTFSWWHIASTWYHEAIPGHHLQCATVIIERDRLSRYQRTDAWTSGYGEGWALYAERLMDELGGFDEPGIEMGYLAGQALRAARIVVDIGMHLQLKDQNGEVWNAETAFDLLLNSALMDEDFARSEVDRYLGWPGQAISYKVGERFWMQAREDAKTRLGSAFELKKFHSFALKLGPMGLDPFAKELANWDGK
jgi:uncharacterized protein (DUF885 family)